jgi:ankyrin repeat protein
MWLTRALYNSWQQLSLFGSEDKYKYILQLCTTLPQIDADFTWDANISLNERFRISCAIGDTKALSEILKKNPHMIGASIFVSPNKLQINSLEFALLYGQKDVVQLLLSYESWKPTKNNLIKMHQIYKNKDICYYNQETDDFLEAYIQQMTDEKADFQD